VPLPDLPGVLTRGALERTVASIAAVQAPSGALPWPDGHTDPWDHVECAMALVLGGRLDAARGAYAWLGRTQAADGSWATSWSGTEVLDHDVDSNQCAYVAVGVWQWWLVTGDRSLVDRMWPVVRSALTFVVGLQQPGGQIAWCRRADGSVDPDALVTGSSSTYQALRCGIALAELVGEPQPSWEVAAGLLQHAVAAHPEAFLDKRRFSMDWYYPVLAGALRGPAARARLERDRAVFHVPGVGLRCVSDRPWVTGAETAELALTLAAVGEGALGRALLAEVQHLREATARTGPGWSSTRACAGPSSGRPGPPRRWSSQPTPWPADRRSSCSPATRCRPVCSSRRTPAGRSAPPSASPSHRVGETPDGGAAPPRR
jgi:hypothetical protein